MFEINEFNTSKLYNKTFKELENVLVRKNKHKNKKHLHEILTSKEKTERCIYLNRDKNSCKNILYLAKYFLRNQSRPLSKLFYNFEGLRKINYFYFPGRPLSKL